MFEILDFETFLQMRDDMFKKRDEGSKDKEEVFNKLPKPSKMPITDYEKFNRGFYNKGIKESEGKLFYELDWNFITQMAERMSSSDKYPVFNWKKPMDVEELKQALFRHVLEVMKGNYEDDGREMGHLEAIATNAQLINYQLKNFK